MRRPFSVALILTVLLASYCVTRQGPAAADAVVATTVTGVRGRRDSTPRLTGCCTLMVLDQPNAPPESSTP
jgi:hypothetical protein